MSCGGAPTKPPHHPEPYPDTPTLIGDYRSPPTQAPNTLPTPSLMTRLILGVTTAAHKVKTWLTHT